jgi:LysW-gamma-L-lysine carboxypeptidase
MTRQATSEGSAVAPAETAVGVLLDLVATPSVSGNERAAVERFVSAARRLGFRSAIDEAGNGVATRGADGAALTIVLLGHIDTVRGDIAVRIEQNVLHGRGSVDAKGPLVTMLVAAAGATLPRDVAIHVVAAVGEETAESLGATHIARTLKPDACIVAEPSGWDGVTLGYKGNVNVTATAICESSHVSGPELSAADQLLQWWQLVNEFVGRSNQGVASIFHQLQASVTKLESSANGLDDRAALRANFRLPPKWSPTLLASALENLAGHDVGLEFSIAQQAHVSPRDDVVVRALSAAIREQGGTPRHKLKTGTADLNVVAPIWQCPIAAYGPGDSSLDHTPRERLDLDEFKRATKVVTSAIELLVDSLVHQTSPTNRMA